MIGFTDDQEPIYLCPFCQQRAAMIVGPGEFEFDPATDKPVDTVMAECYLCNTKFNANRESADRCRTMTVNFEGHDYSCCAACGWETDLDGYCTNPDCRSMADATTL